MRRTAPGSLTTILDLYGAGGSRSLVADSISGILDQRLARKACSDCAVREPMREEEAAALGITSRRKGVHAKGCAACRKTGFRGSVAVAGLLTITPAVRRAIESEGGLAELKAAAGEEAQGVRRALAALVLDGVVSPAEARRIVDPKSPYPPDTA